MAVSSETTSKAVGYFRVVGPTGEENQRVVGTGWGTEQSQLAWRAQQADQLWVLLPPSGPRPSNGNRRLREVWIETWHGKPTQSDVTRGETGNALIKPQSGSEAQ